MRYLILLSLTLIAISISAESSTPIKQAPKPLDPAASGVGLLIKDVKFETLMERVVGLETSTTGRQQ